MKVYVDEKTISYINYYAERIYPDLFSKLKEVDNKYSELGKFGSEQHLNERHELIKDNWKILEIETEVLNEVKRQRLEEMGTVFKGRLVLHQKGGQVEYWTAALRKYETSFKPRTNPYLLLKFLVQNPGVTFSAKDLVVKLNSQREHGNSTDDRRIRDTIKPIRDTLGFKEGSEDDFFIVDNSYYGINCDVELKV